MMQHQGNASFLPSTLVTLMVGLLMTALCTWLLQKGNDTRINQAVDEVVKATSEAILGRVELYQYGLRGARGVILTTGVAGMSAQLFRRYSESRDIAKEFPGARGFGFVRRVPQEAEARFLAQSQAESGSSFRLSQLESHEGDRLYVQFLEPQRDNSAALGFDIGSESHRRQAAQEAIDSGDLRLTQPLTLMQESSKPQQAFLLMMPVYQGPNTPRTVDERRQQAVGLTVAPLVMTDVLADLHLDSANLHIRLSDIGDGEAQRIVFYDNHPDAQAIAGRYTRQFDHLTFGRNWRFELAATPLFTDKLIGLPPFYLALGGALVSLLLAGLAGSLSIARAQRLAIANARMELGAIVQSASDAIIGKDLKGTVTSWNGGAQRLFGFTSAEAVGRSILQLIVPNDRAYEEREMLNRIAQGLAVDNYETVRLHKSGELLQVSITPSPVHSITGVVIGASITARDITLQKQRVETIKVQNEALQEQIEDSHATTQTILDTVVDSVLSIDESGLILSFNPASSRIFGYTTDEIMGRHITLLMPQDRWAAYQRFVARALEKSATDMRSQEMEGLRKDGSVFPARVSVGLKQTAEVRVFVCVVSDITAEVRQRQELLAARDHLLLAAHAAELGVWTLNVRDKSLSWNSRMFELYGRPSEGHDAEIHYDDWMRCLYVEDVLRVQHALEALVERGEEFSMTLRASLPDGQIRYIQAHAMAERDSSGVPLLVAGTHRDITLQYELESTLRQAKISADKANAAKSVLLANMSHEIRTPLNAVLGMLQLLQRTKLDAQQSDYVADAYLATTSLLELLNDILDYSKIEAGKLKLDNHAFEIQTLLKDLAVIVAGNQKSTDVEVIFDIDLRVPLVLVGDGLRIRQILVNLVSNALKFTIAGQVVIGLIVRRREDGYVMLRLSVDDSGIGISTDQQMRIFGGFNQAEASTSRRFGGTGLGLVISNRLVSLMGGKLQLESEPGKGSRFWFDVMLKVPDGPAPASSTSYSQRSAPRVLVVDDNPTSLQVTCRVVRGFGWDVEQASSGREAMECILKSKAVLKPHDVIVMNFRMPDLHGRDIAALILREPSAGHLPPIVLLTAYADQPIDQHSALFKAGTVEILSKPATPWELRDSVSHILEGRPSVPTDPAPLLHSKLLAGVHVLVVEDNVVNRKVASGLLHHEGANVTLAINGLEAVAALLKSPKLFDAVLMDMQMPEMDGLEATRRIRLDPRFRSLPIIAMTANASSDEREACIASGMNDHISKPVDLNKVVTCLKTWLEPKASDHDSRPTDSSDGALLDAWPGILARFGGDRDLLRDVLVIFTADTRKLLGQLDKLAQKGDRVAARAIFHAIKGSASNIGAKLLAMRAGELESAMANGEPATVRALASGSIKKELSEILDASESHLKSYIQ